MAKEPRAERLRSTRAVRVGSERFRLIRDAFLHCQEALRAGYYIEAISIIESILADRLGSLLYGITRQRIDLEHTIGNLLYNWKEGAKKVIAPDTARPLPNDIASFLERDLKKWVKARNKAVHAMAKLERPGDTTFQERYDRLERVALDGVLILTRLDEFDSREKQLAGRRPATFPGALSLAPDIHRRLGAGALAS
jgi:hypothetical protein